jgi:hypothetical protein
MQLNTASTETRETKRSMLIRTTTQACVVMLQNGLTLEIFYADSLTGETTPGRRDRDPSLGPAASQAVWLMGESVLFEVEAGQA